MSSKLRLQHKGLMKYYHLGDFEAHNRAERLKNGIEIPDTIYKQLLTCAEKLNVSIGDDITMAEDERRYETT